MRAAGDAENLALVERLYAALERDDLPGAIELCADDVEWVYPAEGTLAYGGVRHGRDGMLAWADAHDEAEEILDFRVDDMVSSGDTVVALGFFRGRAKSEGRVWETSFAHVVVVRGGLVQRFEAYFDTAAAVAARRT